jgi:hypothetical protein
VRQEHVHAPAAAERDLRAVVVELVGEHARLRIVEGGDLEAERHDCI